MRTRGTAQRNCRMWHAVLLASQWPTQFKSGLDDGHWPDDGHVDRQVQEGG